MKARAPKFPLRVKRGFATVTIYRRAHPKTASGYVFTVAWTVGGRRFLLQRATLAKAQGEAAAKAEQLAAGKLELATAMTTDDAAVLSQARRICGPTPLMSALQEWRQARQLAGESVIEAARAWAARGGAPKPVTVPQAVKAFLKHKKRRGVDTSASYDFFLPRLAEAFPGPISALNATMIEDWMEKLKGERKTVHPVTFNTARKRVVALFRWARNARFLPQDTLTEAERIHTAKETAPRREIMTVADFARALLLLRAEHPDHLAAAVLAGFCGLRRHEIHAQLWGDVNLKAGHLVVTAAKKGTPAERLVEIPAAAVEWLLLCDQKIKLIAPPWAQDRIRAFCRAAKPPIPCPPNAFRHSFVSYRIAATGNVAETSLEAGNSAGVVMRHYRRPVSKADGAAWFALTPAVAEGMGKLEQISTG